MNEEQIAQILALIADGLDVEQNDIAKDSRFAEDLGADSMEMLDLVLHIEEECQIAISDVEVAGVATVADMLRLVETKLA